MGVLDELKKIQGAEILVQMIEEINALDDNLLSEESPEIILDAISNNFTQVEQKEIIRGMIQGYRDSNLTPEQALEQAQGLVTNLHQILTNLEMSEIKTKIVDGVFGILASIALESARLYSASDTVVHIELTHENAKMPQYAHDTDACADIYCPEQITIPARTRGMIVKTGLKMAIQPGWCVKIYPRSSIGVKTPLRLSNSVGIIDSDYRDEVGLILDNTSSKPYTIAAGDRVAQMEVVPVYHAKFNQVDDVSTIGDNRGGGYGSTGA